MEVMRNWEVQSAIAVVSKQQKANNNIIRFIITFLFRGFYHLLIGQRYETKMKNGRNGATISSILQLLLNTIHSTMIVFVVKSEYTTICTPLSYGLHG